MIFDFETRWREREKANYLNGGRPEVLSAHVPSDHDVVRKCVPNCASNLTESD